MKKMQKGFTLIELMIVVAIIGVLSAIAVPAYKSYVKKSEAAAGVSTVRSLLTNIDMYEQEHDAFPSDLTKVGAHQKMSSLGDLAFGAAGNKEISFSFIAPATLAGKKITFTKSTSGWKCEHDTKETLKSCAAAKAPTPPNP